MDYCYLIRKENKEKVTYFGCSEKNPTHADHEPATYDVLYVTQGNSCNEAFQKMFVKFWDLLKDQKKEWDNLDKKIIIKK